MVHQIQCGEIWGGIRGKRDEIETVGIRASLYSRACDGDKGGDIYYFSVCNGDKLSRLVIADVMGHGEKVSQTSQWLYDSIAANMNSLDGTQVFKNVNERAMEIGSEALSVATVASFYTEDQNFSFTYAGHHPILVYEKAKDSWHTATNRNEKGSFPIGMLGEADYGQDDIAMVSGDKFMVYTDGIIEALSPSGELFGNKSLMEILSQNRHESPEQILDEVLGRLSKFTGGDLTHDDVTVIVAEVK